MEGGWNINEICFNDDADESEYYLGYSIGNKKPYWVRHCNAENGCEFESAIELVDATIFDERSFREQCNHT